MILIIAKVVGRGTARIALALLLLAPAACGGGEPGPPGTRTVVATTSIWADVVAVIGGDSVTVHTLIPPGADPHDFAPSAQQVALLTEGDLVVANGLGLEESLADILEEAEAGGVRVVLLAPALDPIQLEGDAGPDPHVWLDPRRVATAVEIIAVELDGIAPDPQRTGLVEAYLERLAQVDAEIEALVSAIPADRRTLVTNHEALGYFADRFGFEVIGTVIPGGTSVGSPSSADLAALVADIEANDVPAIFVETTQPATLAEAVAAEVGRPVAIVELHTESLGEPGSEAASLPGLLLEDGRRIAEALR